MVTYLETSLSCIKVAGVSSLLTLPMFSYRSALLLFSLLAAPSAPCHSCVCQLCGGGLEVYRGTELLLTTSTTNVGLRNITAGADHVYLMGCGCYMIFSGRGKYGRAQKISQPGLHRLDARLRVVGAIFREQVSHGYLSQTKYKVLNGGNRRCRETGGGVFRVWIF